MWSIGKIIIWYDIVHSLIGVDPFHNPPIYIYDTFVYGITQFPRVFVIKDDGMISEVIVYAV